MGDGCSKGCREPRDRDWSMVHGQSAFRIRLRGFRWVFPCTRYIRRYRSTCDMGERLLGVSLAVEEVVMLNAPLIESMMVDCVMMDRTTTPDGEGGFTREWVEGAPFKAAIVKNSSLNAKVAEKQGVTEVYTRERSRTCIRSCSSVPQTRNNRPYIDIQQHNQAQLKRFLVLHCFVIVNTTRNIENPKTPSSSRSWGLLYHYNCQYNRMQRGQRLPCCVVLQHS